MSHERTAEAARNNAIWCDTVWRTHGAPGEFRDAIWLNRYSVPRYYPNAVTLVDAGEAVAHLEGIRDLVEAGLAGSWACKDSFHALDLAPLGFEPLFEAQWIWRPAALPRPDGMIAGVSWRRVSKADELAEWEAAWNGPPGDRQGTPPRIFLPALLEDRQIAFVAAYQERRIVAGAIANRTGDVVGLSNMFTPTHDTARFWAGCVAAAIEAFPGLPITGYERGAELGLARDLGFEPIGPLRVWLHAP